MEAHEGGRILGSLGSANGAGVVRIEGRYDTDPGNLWSAVADPARLPLWYGRVEGDLGPGGEFRLTVDSSGWVGTGRVEACEPPSRLRVSTREADESWQQGRGIEPFEAVIEATVTADGSLALLVIEVRGMPLEMVHSYGAGWQIHAEHLADYLDRRESNDIESRFAELLPMYEGLASRLASGSGPVTV